MQLFLSFIFALNTTGRHKIVYLEATGVEGGGGIWKADDSKQLMAHDKGGGEGSWRSPPVDMAPFVRQVLVWRWAVVTVTLPLECAKAMHIQRSTETGISKGVLQMRPSHRVERLLRPLSYPLPGCSW